MTTHNTDFDEFVNDRIHKIRHMIELDFTFVDDDVVPAGASFLNDELAVLAIPTIGDGVLSVDLVGFVAGRLAKKHTMTIRE